MKTYSVKEIAELLKTNPETVRRWIRQGKLEAIQQSRKGGSVVTEQSLNKFLESAPKYAGIAAGVLGVSGLIAGLPIVAATILGITHMKREAIESAIHDAQVPVSEIEKLIKLSIQNSVKIITQKKEEMREIQNEIYAKESEMEELKKILIKIQESQGEARDDT